MRELAVEALAVEALAVEALAVEALAVEALAVEEFGVWAVEGAVLAAREEAGGGGSWVWAAAGASVWEDWRVASVTRTFMHMAWKG